MASSALNGGVGRVCTMAWGEISGDSICGPMRKGGDISPSDEGIAMLSL